MFEDTIIACCKKLRLSRNLADMAMTMDGESHQVLAKNISMIFKA